MRVGSWKDAAALVEDGATVAFSGAIMRGKPVAAARALAEAGRKDLDLVTFAGSLVMSFVSYSWHGDLTTFMVIAFFNGFFTLGFAYSWMAIYLGVTTTLARRCVALSKAFSAAVSTSTGRLIDSIANADTVRSFAKASFERRLLARLDLQHFHPRRAVQVIDVADLADAPHRQPLAERRADTGCQFRRRV